MQSHESSSGTVPHGAARAVVRWFRATEGGRHDLPKSRRYRSVIRFDDDPNKTRGSWDVELTLHSTPRYDAESSATISFLTGGAPQGLFRIGSGFELTEGRKIVARGKIVPFPKQ